MKITTANGDRVMTVEEAAVVMATQKDAQDLKLNRKVADLWAAADRYIYQYINGVGLAILAAGVHANKPKAIACAKWSDSVWTEYYARKTALLNGDSVSFDFSSVGAMPFDILELRAEIEDLWFV